MSIDPNEFMTVADFARQKGITAEHARRLIRQGRLEAIRFGPTMFLIPIAAAAAWSRCRR